MPETSGPLTPRRRLAVELRRLRGEANLRLDEVADKLLISKSKLSRLENAQGRPHPRDVRDLIRFYRLDGTPLAGTMTGWADAARQRPWWSSYSETLRDRPAGLGTHVAFESEATLARIYTIPLLPVLLQTPDYIRAWYRSSEPWRTDQQLEQLIELRLRRQEAVSERRPRPLELVLVIHEAALRQVVGSAAVMRAQLEALLERSTAPHIDLRVLPFSAAPAYTIGCTYSYFRFDETAPDVVSIETHAGYRQVENAGQLAEYDRHFRDLQERSLTPDATRDLVQAATTWYA